MNRYHAHNGNDSDETGSTATTLGVVMKASLREQLPPSLNIKSANLRVLDPIGHGTD